MSSGTASRARPARSRWCATASGGASSAASSAAASACVRRSVSSGRPARQLLAHEGVPEAVAAAHALEHAGRLGRAEQLRRPRSAPASAASSVRREAVVDHGERREQRARRTARAAASRRATTARSRGGTVTSPEASTDAAELLGEERVARRRALDRGEGARRQRAAGGPLRDRRERARGRAGPAPARPRRRARAGWSARARPPRAAARRACAATTSRRSPAALRARWWTSAAVASSAA